MEADIRQQAYNAAHELCEIAGLKKGQIMVIGCSTSEVVDSRIGTNSDVDVALELFLGIKKALDEKGVYLAAQCCEHLNRAIVVEEAAVPGADIGSTEEGGWFVCNTGVCTFRASGCDRGD